MLLLAALSIAVLVAIWYLTGSLVFSAGVAMLFALVVGGAAFVVVAIVRSPSSKRFERRRTRRERLAK